MAATQVTELPELIDWLQENIEPIQGRQWQIALNSSGGKVEATLKVTESQHDNGRGHKTTISKVVTATFRMRPAQDKRVVFSTD